MRLKLSLETYYGFSRCHRQQILKNLDSLYKIVSDMSDAEIIKSYMELPRDIVLCSECKYCSGKGPIIKTLFCQYFNHDISLNDFCSRGEKESER